MYNLLKKAELTEEDQKVLSSFKTKVTYDDALKTFNIYMFSEITDISDYTNVVDVFMSAQPDECITVHLRTDGGSLDTTTYIRGILELTQADCTCITGDVASAGTMLALAFKNIVVLPNTTWMIHNFSGGAFGKGHELYQHVDYLKSYGVAAYTDFYEGFLDETELENCIKGNDYYFLATEVVERIIRRYELLNSRESSDSGDDLEEATH